MLKLCFIPFRLSVSTEWRKVCQDWRVVVTVGNCPPRSRSIEIDRKRLHLLYIPTGLIQLPDVERAAESAAVARTVTEWNECLLPFEEPQHETYVLYSVANWKSLLQIKWSHRPKMQPVCAHSPVPSSPQAECRKQAGLSLISSVSLYYSRLYILYLYEATALAATFLIFLCLVTRNQQRYHATLRYQNAKPNKFNGWKRQVSGCLRLNFKFSICVNISSVAT